MATSSTSNPSNEKEDTSEECTICLQNCFIDKGTLKCKHSFCFGCIEGWSKHENTCPLCKVRFTYIERVKAPKEESSGKTKSSKKSSKKSKSKIEKVRIKRKSQGDTVASDIRLVPFFPHPMVSALFAANFFAENFRGHEFEWGASDEDDEDYMDGDDDLDYPFLEGHFHGHGHELPIDVFDTDDEDEDDDDNASYRQRLMASINNQRQNPSSVIDLTCDSPIVPSASAANATEPPPARNNRKRRHDSISADQTSSSSSSSSSSQLPITSSSSSTTRDRMATRRSRVVPIAYEEVTSSSSSSSAPQVLPSLPPEAVPTESSSKNSTRLLRSSTSVGRANKRAPLRTTSLPSSSSSSF